MGRAAEKLLGLESRWLMSRLMPRQFLDGVGDRLDEVAPDRKDETIAAIKDRADELADADDTASDNPSKGAVAICAVVLASYEALLPLFDNDKERTLRELQQMMRAVLQRPYETIFGGLSRREDGLDKLESACRKEEPFYGANWDIEYVRPREDLFEMKVHRCFYKDFFERHDVLLLTTVMCAFDVNFMRAIDPAESGLRAERSSLMSLGDEECRFAVIATDDPKALYSDVLEQRFADSSDSA